MMTEEEMMLQEELTLQEASDMQTDSGQDRPQKLTALLKDLMAARSITPTQLANTLGLNPSNVTGFLQGKKNPTLSTLDRFAAALGVPTWRLLNTPEEVLADLRGMGLAESAGEGLAESAESAERKGLAESAESADVSVASGFAASGDGPAESAETPASGLGYDLLTVDPQTGETRLYRLVKP